MSHVALIGGHGRVALLAAPLLVRSGHTVTSVVRNPDHVADVEETGARAVVADVESMSEAALADLLAGHDTVVWSAGAGGGDPRRTYAVDRDAAIRSMDAAATAGVERYVMVSYAGAGPDHGVPEDDPFFAYAEAKAAADEHLRASGLSWTVLKPSRLTSGPAGGVDVGRSGPSEVSRATVAAVIDAVLAQPAGALGRTELEFDDGDAPVAEAVAALAR